MRLSFAVTLLSLSAAALTVAAFEYEHDVLLIDQDNFDEALEKHSAMLIHFHPDEVVCPACANINIEFNDAAQQLKEAESKPEGLAFARFSTEYEDQVGDIMKQYDIVYYPAVLFFKKHEDGSFTHSRYIGSHHSHAMVSWLLKKAGQSAYRRLHSPEDLEEFAQDNEAAVVGIFKDSNSNEAKAFLRASQIVLDDGVNFGLMEPNEENLKKEFEGSDKVAKIYIMKQYDELLVVYSDKPYDSVDEIVKFVRLRAFPYVTDFSPDAEGVQHSFGNTKILRHCVLFAPKSDENTQKIYNEFRNAAREMREELSNNMTFVFVDTSAPDNQVWWEYFRIDPKNVPQIVITLLDGRGLTWTWHRPETEGGRIPPITSKGIEQHVRNFFEDKLNPDYFKDEL